MKFYVAGPMSGYAEKNFPAFHAAARMLRAMGHEVFNPAELGGNEVFHPSGTPTQGARDMLGADVAFISGHADGIYMLAGWENSKGAQAEWALARALGLRIYYESNVPPGRHFPDADFSVIGSFEGQIGLA